MPIQINQVVSTSSVEKQAQEYRAIQGKIVEERAAKVREQQKEQLKPKQKETQISKPVTGNNKIDITV